MSEEINRMLEIDEEKPGQEPQGPSSNGLATFLTFLGWTLIIIGGLGAFLALISREGMAILQVVVGFGVPGLLFLGFGEVIRLLHSLNGRLAGRQNHER